MSCSSLPMFLWLCILFCGSAAEAGPIDELSKANNGFAVDLYQKIGEANNGKNLFFSPISISTAFGMVSLGAKGKTRGQIKAVLRLNKIRSDEGVKQAYQQLLMELRRQVSGCSLHLANRLFGSNSFVFNQKFLRETQIYFEAPSESLDFVGKPEESRQHINQWVEDQTNKTIKDILPSGSIDADTMLFVVSAIYLKASWVFPFSERLTKSGPFSISKSQTRPMEMMHLYDEYLDYYNSSQLKCEVLKLPYKGAKASMFVFLPHNVEGLPKLEKRLTGKILADTLRRVQRRNMIVQLPKFTIDQTISLKTFLKTMGMTNLFETTPPNQADLSGIGRPGPLVVTDAMHKAFVNVSETGTEAAAATFVGFQLLSMPPPPIRFIVNRPFLFMIYEKNAKSVLFMGRLVQP